MKPETGLEASRGRARRALVLVWLPFLTIILGLAAGAGPAKGKGNGSTLVRQPVFTLELWDEELKQPGRWFPLGSRVVARISCRGLPPGRHELSLVWLNPGGREEERTRLQVIAPAAGQAGAEVRTSAWLKINQGLLARTFGLKKGSRLGRWEVRLFWQGREVARGWFVLG
jgi:hypothetical protein